ncbi:hypothetical protein AALP_AAs51730U000100 [Arabis alpina]|uniref:DUF4283 domain-containing protein n=1 Tax=Arabis alpina TaxID=50452 RepID=A0A087G3E0_ARAAL|nr:hypothetical protein AALP_AAs51730U000100 [Arabis alpina]
MGDPPPGPVPPDLVSRPVAVVSSSSRPIVEAPPAVVVSSALPSVSVVNPVTSFLAPTPWIAKFKSSFKNLSKVGSPSYSEDGTPTVQAQASITLCSSQIWKDHLVSYFHGLSPSAAKIFSDLNPIWGKNGRISVKHQSPRISLIYIPCVVTRQWVLDVGLWNSGNCSFTVTPWSQSACLAPMKLVHAPIWVLFKKVPPELWSFVGFSTIASGVGLPVHSEFAKLSPYSNGVVKLKVVVELEKSRPSSVIVKDSVGNSVLVSAEYPKLLPRCGLCKEFGHLGLRCPSLVSGVSRLPLSPVLVATKAVEKPQEPSKEVEVDSSSSLLPGLVRACSLPSLSLDKDEVSSSGGWLRVARTSKHRPLPEETGPVPSQPVTSSQFVEENALINAAQAIMRQKIAANEVIAPAFIMGTARKRARRKQRQKLLLLSLSSSDLDPGTQVVLAPTSMNGSPSSLSVSKGQLLLQSVSPSNA